MIKPLHEYDVRLVFVGIVVVAIIKQRVREDSSSTALSLKYGKKRGGEDGVVFYR